MKISIKPAGYNLGWDKFWLSIKSLSNISRVFTDRHTNNWVLSPIRTWGGCFPSPSVVFGAQL